MLTLLILLVRVNEPVVQGDVLVDDRSEVLAPVDVVCAHCHPQRLVLGELLDPLDNGLAQRNRSCQGYRVTFKNLLRRHYAKWALIHGKYRHEIRTPTQLS